LLQRRPLFTKRLRFFRIIPNRGIFELARNFF